MLTNQKTQNHAHSHSLGKMDGDQRLRLRCLWCTGTPRTHRRHVLASARHTTYSPCTRNVARTILTPALHDALLALLTCTNQLPCVRHSQLHRHHRTRHHHLPSASRTGSNSSASASFAATALAATKCISLAARGETESREIRSYGNKEKLEDSTTAASALRSQS